MNNYRVLGFATIHYGLEYLRESLLSVRDHVEKMVIAYTRQPSHGHGTTLICPDKEGEILMICREILGDKLIWDVQDQYPNEASHREKRYDHAHGYDAILTVDADEVMVGIPEAIQYAMSSPDRYFGIKGYVNFFRSFSWACYDGFRPIRIENLRNQNHRQNLECPLTIYHFSCAQKESIMRYRYGIFGHASEIKKDYLNEIFYRWSPENNFPDLHPVSIGLWNATPFDKTLLPDYMRNHPYYNLELIS